MPNWISSEEALNPQPDPSANYPDKHRWRVKTIDRGEAIDLDFTVSDDHDAEEPVLKLSRSNSDRPEFQLYNNAIVANNGNVGIGTSNTTNARLTVAGDIHTREVRVTIDCRIRLCIL